MCVRFAAYTDAVAAFKKLHNVRSEGSFMNNNTHSVTIALAPEPIVKLLCEMHKAMNEEEWSLSGVKKKKGKEKRGGAKVKAPRPSGALTKETTNEFGSGFQQLLLRDKKRVTRWNLISKLRTLQEVFEHPDSFKSWDEVTNFVSAEIAFEAVIETLLVEARSHFDVKAGGGNYSIRAEREGEFPRDAFSLSVFPVENFTGIVVDGLPLSEYVRQRLVRFVMDAGRKKMLKRNVPAPPKPKAPATKADLEEWESENAKLNKRPLP